MAADTALSWSARRGRSRENVDITRSPEISQITDNGENDPPSDTRVAAKFTQSYGVSRIIGRSHVFYSTAGVRTSQPTDVVPSTRAHSTASTPHTDCQTIGASRWSAGAVRLERRTEWENSEDDTR